jgi:hypothetical protein
MESDFSEVSSPRYGQKTTQNYPKKFIAQGGPVQLSPPKKPQLPLGPYIFVKMCPTF